MIFTLSAHTCHLVITWLQTDWATVVACRRRLWHQSAATHAASSSLYKPSITSSSNTSLFTAASIDVGSFLTDRCKYNTRRRPRRLLLTTTIQRETNIATCKRTFLHGLFPPLRHFLDTSCDWIRQQVQKMRGRTLNMPLISYYIRYQRRRLAVLDLKSWEYGRIFSNIRRNGYIWTSCLKLDNTV